MYKFYKYKIYIYVVEWKYDIEFRGHTHLNITD